MSSVSIPPSKSLLNRPCAERFLNLLDEGAEAFCFQTFDDNKSRGDKSLARVFYGTLDEHWASLCELSSRGAGIFVTINQTDGRGRKRANITAIRALWRELDRQGTPELPIEPHVIVESSAGKYHEYVLVDESDDFGLFSGLMARLVADFGSDPNAADVSRVLRLPGFPHQKDPKNPWLVRIVHESGAQPYALAEVAKRMPPLTRPARQQDIPAGKGIQNAAEVRSALAALDPDMDYREWLAVGMALHHAARGGKQGLELWDQWSGNGALYKQGECLYRYASFGQRNGQQVTLKTLFKLAREAGWRWRDDTTTSAQRQAPQRNVPPLEAYVEDLRPQGELREEEQPYERLPIVRFTLDDLITPPPPPPFIIAGYLPQDAYIRNGTGGTGKSTQFLQEAVHIILGKPLWGMEILKPGPVVLITAEDGADRLRWRLFNIVNQMGLPRSERQHIADNLHIVDLVGTGTRLAVLDRNGNIGISSLPDRVIETFESTNPSVVNFDPLIKFSPGERFVNDGEDAVINAVLRVNKRLECAAGCIHHVSKVVLREGIVDHLSGRGGAALGDGARAVYQLVTITKQMAEQINCTHLLEDIEQGRLLAYHITKLTDGPRPSEPFILKRNGWLFEPVVMPSEREKQEQRERDRHELLQADIETVKRYLMRNALKPSLRDLEALHDDIGISRNRIRAAVTKGLATHVFVTAALPIEEQRGQKKAFIRVAQ